MRDHVSYINMTLLFDSQLEGRHYLSRVYKYHFHRIRCKARGVGGHVRRVGWEDMILDAISLSIPESDKFITIILVYMPSGNDTLITNYEV